MRILVACEFSGRVRDSFISLGYDAISCDILPTEQPGPHYQGDVFDILNDGFDMMIAFPPCTYLSFAANHVWNSPGRAEKRLVAADFFMKLYNSPIKHVAIENPLGFMSQAFRSADQVIHPCFFGDPYKKRTCLWLKNLPALSYDMPLFGLNKPVAALPGVWTELITTNRKHVRSYTFPGVARAMAAQWGSYLCEMYSGQINSKKNSAG